MKFQKERPREKTYKFDGITSMKSAINLVESYCGKNTILHSQKS